MAELLPNLKKKEVKFAMLPYIQCLELIVSFFYREDPLFFVWLLSVIFCRTSQVFCNQDKSLLLGNKILKTTPDVT